jgi:hypothetical protein
VYEITKKLAATHASIQENEVAMFAGRKAVFHNHNKMREKNALIIQEIQFKNELVNSLNFNNLAKIKIPNIHDKTNDVWLWVIQCVYQESSAQYWWDNFKK